MQIWTKLRNLFGRKRKGNRIEETDDFTYQMIHTENFDLTDSAQRQKILEDALLLLEENALVMEELTDEYGIVTSYLADMEEVEALPTDDKEALELIARKIGGFEKERRDYREKKNRMAESEYLRMSQQEEEIEDGIRKMKEAESYQRLVKQDMQRLDAERHAYAYRGKELDTMLANLKGMSVIVLTALIICVFLLFVLQFALQMEIFVGYFVAVICAVIAIVVFSVKYRNAQSEIERVENAVNRLILLQNKVKIRYANNTKLLEYLRLKYHTERASVLEKQWKSFLQEREERRQFAEAEAKVTYYQHELVDRLSKYHIRTPQRWIHQVSAILDPKEMVEVRHELIIRRQALRKQMDDQTQSSSRIQEELLDIAKRYPEFAEELHESFAKKA
ncbi:MAG: hypothetical protein LBM69_09615 [Lachnospiraceae bacterium]|nr:hypothetical protein [Lachnospiraceae bacterium]